MEKGTMDQKDTTNVDQKNAMDMKSGSSEAVADAPVAVISSYKGGMAPVEKMAEPAMAKGMTHMVSQRLVCSSSRTGPNIMPFRSP